MTPEDQTKPTPATTSGAGDNLAAGAAPAADADLNKAAADLAGIAGENLASGAENDSPGSPAESSAPAAAAKPVTHAHLDGDSQELKPAPAPIEPAAPLPGSIGSVESGSSVAADAAVPADTAQAGAAMMATDVPVPGKATPATPASVAEPTPGDPAVAQNFAEEPTPLMGAVDLGTPAGTPETTPGATPEAAPAATPETAPGATPEAAPAATPETTNATSVAAPAAAMPETGAMPATAENPLTETPATPETTPETTPGATPEATPEATPATTPEAPANTYAGTGDALAPQIPTDPYGAGVVPPTPVTPQPPVDQPAASGDIKLGGAGKGQNKTRLILIVVVGLLVLAAAAFGVFWLVSNNQPAKEPETAVEPEPEPEAPAEEPQPTLLTCTDTATEEELADLGDSDVTAYQQQYSVDFNEDGMLTQIMDVSYITYTTSDIAEARLRTLQRSYEDYMINNLSLESDPFTSTYVVASTNNLQAVVTHTAAATDLDSQNAAFFNLGFLADVNTGEEDTDTGNDTGTGTGGAEVNTEQMAPPTSGYLDTLATVQERYETMGYSCTAQ